MKKIILLISLFLGGFNLIGVSVANDGTGCGPGEIQLNTDVPGVGNGKGCISQKDAANSFGSLMGAMMKILINMTVAISFIALIAAGVMMSLSGASQSTAGKGKELLKKVILGIVLLGLSGIILHTINPNFFKTGLTIQLIQQL